ncbi:MAG: tetratricopeptide repeat protein [Treponema sp.]|nr:tetratricopeptide repeat protein [Treponema sp.]
MVLKNSKQWLLLSGLFFVTGSLISCATGASSIQETPLSIHIPITPETPAPIRSSDGGLVDRIRLLTETGTPQSLLRALDLIRDRDLGNGDFGRTMNIVILTLLQKVYPDIGTNIPRGTPSRNHTYTRILRDAEGGNYTAPPSGSQDYLEYVLPFMALLSETKAELLLNAVPDLRRAEVLNPSAVLAPYFLGLVYERSGRRDEARIEYNRAWRLSEECYPAALGLARIMQREGQAQSAIRLLQDLVIRYPDHLSIKRELTFAYYRRGDWSRAEPAIAELLQRNSRDGEYILMQAHVLVEQGEFHKAQAPLDQYASINPNNPLYLFLRARVQAEGYHNRDAALNYLRSLLKSSTADDAMSIYAARMLMESNRIEDQHEGRDLLGRLLRTERPSLGVLDLALQDAIHREAWKEAQPYLERLLDERRSAQDLLNAYKVFQGMGNSATALVFAQELHEGDPANEEGSIAYIAALINTKRQSEARQMIENRLADMPGGAIKSQYYYLRSRTEDDEEAMLNALRASIFEDPRNLYALIALFEIYHQRKDERRTLYYLKQALALAPDNPYLRRYADEYAL